MLKKPGVQRVMVQATYMSGDRNTIASALKVDLKLGVLILAPPGARAAANELLTFYRNVAGDLRIDVCEAPAVVGKDAESSQKIAYRDVSNYAFDSRRNGRPAWLTGRVATDVPIESATWGTKVITRQFGNNADVARNKIRDLWRLDHLSSKGKASVEDLQGKVWAWLKAKGFRQDRPYVFLFAKQGARTAEKAHHFTSIMTWNLLQDEITRKTSVIPVAAGDRIGLRTAPTLAEFWNEPEWKAIFKDFEKGPMLIDKRAAQLGMWCYLAESLTGCRLLGCGAA